MVPPDIKYPYLESSTTRSATASRTTCWSRSARWSASGCCVEGYDAMIFPTTGLHPKPDSPEHDRPRDLGGLLARWAEMYSPFRYTFGPFSHRHAATRAGLGEFGYNNVVLTPSSARASASTRSSPRPSWSPDPLIDEADLPARRLPALPEGLHRSVRHTARRCGDEGLPQRRGVRPQPGIHRHASEDRSPDLHAATRPDLQLADPRRLRPHLSDSSRAESPAEEARRDARWLDGR